MRMARPLRSVLTLLGDRPISALSKFKNEVWGLVEYVVRHRNVVGWVAVTVDFGIRTNSAIQQSNC
jgi:hypothetical protein